MFKTSPSLCAQSNEIVTGATSLVKLQGLKIGAASSLLKMFKLVRSAHIILNLLSFASGLDITSFQQDS